MRELVVVLRRLKGVEQAQYQSADVEIIPVREENNNTTLKQPSINHDGQGTTRVTDETTCKAPPRQQVEDNNVPKLCLNHPEVASSGCEKTEKLVVSVTRDPVLDRLALASIPRSDGSLSKTRNINNRGKRRRLRSSNDAIFSENLPKDKFMSQLSLLPYNVALRTRRSAQKRLEAFSFKNRCFDLWNQISERKNLLSNKGLRITVQRNPVLDRLALLPIQSIDLKSLKDSKVTKCKRLLPSSKVLLHRESDSRLATELADDADVTKSCCGQTVTLQEIAVGDQATPLKNSTVDTTNDSPIDRICVEKADSVFLEDEMLEPNMVGKVDVCNRTSSEPTIEEQLVRVPGSSSAEKPLGNYPFGNVVESLKRHNGNAVPLCGTPSIRLRRVNGDNWALLQPSPTEPPSTPLTTAPVTTCSKNVFIKLHRDSNIDRLALQDTKPSFPLPNVPVPIFSSPRELPSEFSPRATRSRSRNTWPKLTVEAEVHNENENPRKNSRSRQKILYTIRNVKKFKPCSNIGCCKNRVNRACQITNHSISQYMVVKKPLTVRSDLCSINIDPPHSDSD